LRADKVYAAGPFRFTAGLTGRSPLERGKTGYNVRYFRLQDGDLPARRKRTTVKPDG
jgi:hypothetical protein